MTYRRYSPDVEQPDADEQETIDGIIAGMTRQSETVGAREQHAVRASHAKSTACVVGELVIAAHRPLGSVMRARLQVYQALSAVRHHANGVAEVNTAHIEEIPA